MNTLTFTIPGEPQGKGRPRVTKRGTFTPTKTKRYQEKVKACFIYEYCKAHPVEEPLTDTISRDLRMAKYLGVTISPHTGPVRIEIVAYLRRPKSHYGTGRNAGKLKGTAPVWPLKKPDFDNIEKAIADALNGLAYKDDAQIVDSHFLKLYQLTGFEPCVKVSVILFEQETIAEHSEKGVSRCGKL